jgi:hypothetical protein
MNLAPLWMEQLGLDSLGATRFFRSPTELDSLDRPLPLAQSMRRAWEAMGLDGVLCVDGAPLVYFKELPHHDLVALADLHRVAWNNGLAPLLVAITPSEIRVYSTLALPAASPQDLDSTHRLARLFDRVADALDLLHLVRAIEFGEFFRTHQQAFDTDQRVDVFLLDNLDAARHELFRLGGLDLRGVHALLGRVVFTCYLVDRGIITADYFASAGAPGATSLQSLLEGRSAHDGRTLLYALFRNLRTDFNGDVFGAELEAEERLVSPGQIDVLRRFLRGDSLVTGQISLGFWVYNFRVIPIETISAIYEQALEAEGELEVGDDGKGYRRSKGAFYTPRHLAQIAVEVALQRSRRSLLSRRVLDPACGSGIFLVTVFNLMAEEWQRTNPAASKSARFVGLSHILTDNLFGVDESAAACGVAALSMYLSLLDRLTPPDIQELQRDGSLLPRLVHNPDDGARSGRTIFVSNFFDEELPLPSPHFDLIVGNPPWTSVGDDDPMVRWCSKRQLPLAQNQLAYGFVWKAAEHVAQGGLTTFVLPAAMLFNSQEKALIFLREWLRQNTVETIVNLADLSNFLFRDARRPAIIARYSPEKPSLRTDVVEYVVPKAQPEALFAEILSIAAEDRVMVRLADGIPRRSVVYRRARWVKVLTPPLLWKRRLWGTGRDGKLLDRLSDFPPLFSDEEGGSSPVAWTLREGFNRHGKGKPERREALGKLKYLHETTSYVLRPGALASGPGFDVTNYCPPEEVFYGPHIVFPHGASLAGERLRAAFSDENFTFSHSIRVIKGGSKDKSLLRFVTCVLCSPLALYVFFHSAGSWASERRKIHVTEYASLPFPRPDTAERVRIVEQAAALHRELERVVGQRVLDDGALEAHGQQLDELVYQYYDVDDSERALIEDTVQISIPSATPIRPTNRSRGNRRIPTLDPSTDEERTEYRRTLCATLSEWAVDGEWRFRCIGTTAASAGLGIASLSRIRAMDAVEPTHIVPPEASAVGQLNSILERIGKRMGTRPGGTSANRLLKVFDGSDLHIVKPLARRYWTRTAALNDADEVAAAILTSKGKCRSTTKTHRKNSVASICASFTAVEMTSTSHSRANDSTFGERTASYADARVSTFRREWRGL